MRDEQPQFVYLATAFDFQATILLFVFSIRPGNFRIYKQCLIELMLWMSVMDHVNCARWPRSNTFAKLCGKNNTVSSFSTAAYQCRCQKNLLQRSQSHETSHPRCQQCGIAAAKSTSKKKKKKKKKNLHRRAGKLILPNPPLSTEQTISALRI